MAAAWSHGNKNSLVPTGSHSEGFPENLHLHTLKKSLQQWSPLGTQGIQGTTTTEKGLPLIVANLASTGGV